MKKVKRTTKRNIIKEQLLIWYEKLLEAEKERVIRPNITN